MTGTPVPNSPFDVYTQLKFLEPDVWKRMGCGTFAAFKAMFGVWIEHERKDNGQRFSTLVDYQNLAILNKVVDRMGERLLKDDVLDLPPKLYDKRTFTMCPEQRRLYDELKSEFIIWLDNGDSITAPLAITRMLRLQQVTSGYCPTDDGGTLRITPNARLTCLMDTIEDIPHQCIVFAKFQDDIDQIAAALEAKNETYVVYDGRVSQTDREERRAAFKSGAAKFFVANPAAAGEGLTLHMAKTVCYYNTTYKLGERLQSEDRAHRAGMDDQPVNYIDIIATGTIDTVILRALRTKVNLANQVTGDKVRAWL
jgi:SNF2 family DNA or RNA helicase